MDKIQNKEGEHFAFKRAELEQLTFPDIPEDELNSFENYSYQLSYMNKHKVYSAEEMILKQKKLLLDDLVSLCVLVAQSLYRRNRPSQSGIWYQRARTVGES